MDIITDEYGVIDLFCGVGGLTHGFVIEGFKVLAGIDLDASCKYPYEHNNGAKFIHSPIENLDVNYLKLLYGKLGKKILVGCAPCQPFSPYNKKNASEDEKWKLLHTFSDIIDLVNPDIISMENVPDLKTYHNGEVYNDFVDRLSKNYSVSSYVVYCPDYGIPQKRTRLVLFASRYGSVKLIRPTHKNKYKTVQKVIGNLAPLRAGEVFAADPLHRCSKLSDKNIARI